MNGTQTRTRTVIDELVADDSREYWNRRAKTFGRKCGRNEYVEEFIDRLVLRKNETVLDMGCATGTLALPLARRGHSVFACDFSPRMIDQLNERAVEGDVPVTPRLMAWQDDWEAMGFGSDSVDVAFASRSIPSGGRGGALPLVIEKLDATARRRAALTTAASPIPLYEPRLMEYLGRPVPTDRSDGEAISLLMKMGRYPELSYIICPRPMHFSSLEEGIDELRRMSGYDPLDSAESRLFEEYAHDHFQAVEEEGKLLYRLDYPLSVRWAFIAWDIEER